MEIIIALVLVVVGVFLFYNRKSKAVESTVEESVPYKVETPVVTETVEEVKVAEEPVKKTRTPRATKPAAKKVAAKKPAAKKTSAKAKKSATK